MSELSITRKRMGVITEHIEEIEELIKILALKNKKLKVYLDELGLSLDEISNIAWGDASLRRGKLSKLAYAEYTQDLPDDINTKAGYSNE